MKLKIAKWSYAVAFKPIKPNKEGQDLIGEIDEYEGTICIAPGMKPHQNLRTLWHEIIHGILYVRASLKYASHSEPMISLLEHCIIEFFQDNPDMAYLGVPPKVIICGIPYTILNDNVNESSVDMYKATFTLPNTAESRERNWQLIVNLALVTYAEIARLDKTILNQQLRPLSHQLYQIMSENSWLVHITLVGEFSASPPDSVSTISDDLEPSHIVGQNGVLLDALVDPSSISNSL